MTNFGKRHSNTIKNQNNIHLNKGGQFTRHGKNIGFVLMAIGALVLSFAGYTAVWDIALQEEVVKKFHQITGTTYNADWSSLIPIGFALGTCLVGLILINLCPVVRKELEKYETDVTYGGYDSSDGN